MRIAKITHLVFFVILVFASEVLSQIEINKQAELRDSFGRVTNGDLRARLDVFLAELFQTPGTRGLVVLYGTFNEIKGREKSILSHINFRRFDPSRVRFTVGGSISEFRTDLWVIPSGVDPPKIEPEAFVAMEFRKSTKVMATKLVTEFLTKLQNVDGGQGHIINYGTPRQIATREKWIRDSISFRRFDGSRITLVNGGPGSVRTVLWIVPQGAKNPAP